MKLPTREDPMYPTWAMMKQRCLNPRAMGYARWGGRGITICKRWSDSFAAFVADMGPKPSAKHTLDRIDNDGNYEPANCRWATRAEQNANSRRAKGERVNTAKVTAEIVTQCRARYAAGGISQQRLADEAGLDQTTMSDLLRGVTWAHVHG